MTNIAHETKNGTNETTNEARRTVLAMTSAKYGLASGVSALAVDLTLLASAVENGGGALTLADIGHSTERIAERARYLAELADDLQIQNEELRNTLNAGTRELVGKLQAARKATKRARKAGAR